MLCMVNFTTANIYNVHEHTVTCDLKNYVTPLRNINRREYQLKRCYIGFPNTIEIDVDAYQRSFNCDIKISHFAVLLVRLLTDSENMLKLKRKNAKDIHSSRFGTDGCLRSSLEVLKTDRTFCILLLTLAKTEMNDVQI